MFEWLLCLLSSNSKIREFYQNKCSLNETSELRCSDGVRKQTLYSFAAISCTRNLIGRVMLSQPGSKHKEAAQLQFQIWKFNVASQMLNKLIPLNSLNNDKPWENHDLLTVLSPREKEAKLNDLLNYLLISSPELVFLFEFLGRHQNHFADPHSWTEVRSDTLVGGTQNNVFSSETPLATTD